MFAQSAKLTVGRALNSRRKSDAKIVLLIEQQTNRHVKRAWAIRKLRKASIKIRQDDDSITALP